MIRIFALGLVFAPIGYYGAVHLRQRAVVVYAGWMVIDMILQIVYHALYKIDSILLVLLFLQFSIFYYLYVFIRVCPKNGEEEFREFFESERLYAAQILELLGGR